MNTEAQRIAIAEACGWTNSNDILAGSWVNERIKGMGYTVWPKLPDYLNDLNAMHEAEKHLNIPANIRYHAWNNYRARLDGITGGSSFHATAAQRAEAFLRTLGRWVVPATPPTP